MTAPLKFGSTTRKGCQAFPSVFKFYAEQFPQAIVCTHQQRIAIIHSPGPGGTRVKLCWQVLCKTNSDITVTSHVVVAVHKLLSFANFSTSGPPPFCVLGGERGGGRECD